MEDLPKWFSLHSPLEAYNFALFIGALHRKYIRMKYFQTIVLVYISVIGSRVDAVNRYASNLIPSNENATLSPTESPTVAISETDHLTNSTTNVTVNSMPSVTVGNETTNPVLPIIVGNETSDSTKNVTSSPTVSPTLQVLVDDGTTNSILDASATTSPTTSSTTSKSSSPTMSPIESQVIANNENDTEPIKDKNDSGSSLRSLLMPTVMLVIGAVVGLNVLRRIQRNRRHGGDRSIETGSHFSTDDLVYT